jgi:hypothetical protein
LLRTFGRTHGTLMKVKRLNFAVAKEVRSFIGTN